MKLYCLRLLICLLLTLIKAYLSLSPIYHIKGTLTEENELYIYSFFEKVNRFYKMKMNDIKAEFITTFNKTDIQLTYANLKMPSSLRRKTHHMLKPFFKHHPYLNDLIRCYFVFKKKESLFQFDTFLKLKYGHYIRSYDNLIENKSSRLKIIILKYSHPLPHLSMNSYTKDKCYFYPFFEIQLHLHNHYQYQFMTHWLYDGFRCLKAIELNYNKPEFYIPFDYLNETMSMHPIHILQWIHKATGKETMSSFELMFYRTYYYLIHKMGLFKQRTGLKQFELRYLTVCRMFLYKRIGSTPSSDSQLQAIVRIEKAINDLLTHIHAFAVSKDTNE